MKIFTAEQIKNWDAYTIQNEPIASIDLMERAAHASVEWLILQNLVRQPIHIFCGKGNNGADGLAIARLLLKQGCTVSVYILEFGYPGTDEFQTNLHRLHGLTFNIHFIQEQGFFPEIPSGHLIIDSIFGTGLNKPLEGITEKLIRHLNQSNNLRVAIDIPTGMFADTSSKDCAVFHADFTLSFQVPKLCFFLSENEDDCGAVHILDIGLLPSYVEITESKNLLTEVTFIKKLIRPRHAYAHKGNYGHALIMGGSYGKMGAALLAAKACLHSGSGLVTVYTGSGGFAAPKKPPPPPLPFWGAAAAAGACAWCAFFSPSTPTPRCRYGATTPPAFISTASRGCSANASRALSCSAASSAASSPASAPREAGTEDSSSGRPGIERKGNFTM